MSVLMASLLPLAVAATPAFASTSSPGSAMDHAAPVHGVTGNPAAIAAARASIVVETRMGGFTEIETGYAFMKDEVGKSTSVGWTYGTGVAPAGFVPVVEHLSFGLHAGRIVWLSDVMVPRCSATLCSDLPFQVVLTRSGLIGHFDVAGLAPTTSCWFRLTGSVDGFSVGSDLLALSGRFDPVVHDGPIERITSIVPVGRGRTWTEIGAFSTASRLVMSEVVHSSAGAGIPAFSFTETSNQWFLRTHAPPRVTLCAG